MTSEEQRSPAAEKHSPEEIVKNVKRTQEEYDIPAVSSREAAKLLKYKDDYVTVKLNQMVDDGLLGGYKTGAGYIYWVPEEGKASDEVDVSSVGSDDIELENIDPEEFPREKAREIAEANLAEFEDDTWWQHQYKTGYAMMQAGGIGFGIGIGILLTDSALVEGFSVPQLIFELGAVLFVFGGIAIAFAAVLMLLTYLGQRAVDRGWLSADISFPRPW